MALHLVGETTQRLGARGAAQDDGLLKLWRGIYVDGGDDVDQVVLRHAVRIAAYLYPNAYLAGASAATLAPTLDGRLFLSGRRNQRTRIRALEIIQNEAPTQPSTVPVIVGDDMGEVHLTASSPRQRFLEAFRLRGEHAGAIDPGLRRRFAERLLAEYGTAAATADALWALGRANGWIREAQSAERYLLNDVRASPAPVNRAGLDLHAAWHGRVVGRLTHDGAEWRWRGVRDEGPNLVRETRPGSLPPFVESLLPEGWLARVLHERDDRDTLRSGSRYMSNMIIVEDEGEISGLPADVLEGRLALFQEQGRFTGRYHGPRGSTFEGSFQEKLAEMFAVGRTPRLSGIQIKAPMYLGHGGELLSATHAPFTHILKPAGTSGFEHLPIVEWICLTLARAAGFEVPEAVLLDMPGGLAPALLVERFDIRRTADDTNRLALEDFCSVLDLPAARKYDGTIERIARGLRPLSTDPDADMEVLFLRALFAWLIGDGDMHLKNLALLKVAGADATHFTSVRFAPVYDAVTTRVFPGLENDRMALKLNGRDDSLGPQDFHALARTIDIPRARASVLMASCARSVVDALPGLALPVGSTRSSEIMLARVRRIAEERCDPFV